MPHSDKSHAVDTMTRLEIVAVLRSHGFQSGRLIALSKSGYRKALPKHWVIYNAKVFTGIKDVVNARSHQRLADLANNVRRQLLSAPGHFSKSYKGGN